MALTLMKGSEAIAEAAIRAGARFFFGYPITPQTEIPEYMSARMPEIGGCFLQAESEVAAINMVYGAAGTGARVITSSSSPGVSLKQEGISYCAGARVPAVIVNVMRGGPGLGNIQASQGDYFQGVKGGGNGDYHLLTYAPSSIQEFIDIMMFAYEKAEKYRIPVLFLADGIIAQMMEPVEMPEMVDYKIDPEKKPWACTGWKPGDDPAKRGVINSIYIDTETLSVHNDELQAVYKEVVANEQMVETYNCEGAEYIITAFGTVARIAKSAIAELKAKGINPTLAVVRVGEREDDLSYERGVMTRCGKVGVAVKQFVLPADATQEQLLRVLDEVNTDDGIHGCLLFRPLPKQFDDRTVRAALRPEKDVDGITDGSLAGVFTNTELGYAPCTAQACMEILKYYNVPLSGKRAVVVGRSLVVGKPAAMMLDRENATVTLCNSRTQNLPEVCRQADIVVVAMGKMAAVGADCLRAGQTVVDVGIHVNEEGKLCGDVQFDAAEPVVDAITPVPGGVGTVTTSVLVGHVVQAACKKAGIEC